jgi:hypothetical protein
VLGGPGRAAPAFSGISGAWTVAAAVPPPGGFFGIWWYNTWVGIDGAYTKGSQDVLQAGTLGVVVSTDFNGDFNTSYFAWTEWFPDNWVVVPNFPVNAGDSVWVQVLAIGNNLGLSLLVNLNAGNVTVVVIRPQQGQTLTGDTAEWVVERPQLNGVPSQLADYGEVNFTNGVANDTAGTLYQATTGTSMTMLDNNGNPVSGEDTTQSVHCTYLATTGGFSG